jgi:hypothetical protein
MGNVGGGGDRAAGKLKMADSSLSNATREKHHVATEEHYLNLYIER